MGDLQIIEFKNQRVLTTQQLAQVYETESKNIQMNFANNKDRFIEGRDYHLLEGAELKAFKNSLPNDIGLVDKHARSLYLWTERGANRHSKILDTDKAWQQFDVLEETYFQVKTGQIALPQMSQLEILAQVAQAAAEQEKAIKQIASDVRGIRDIVALNPNDWRRDATALINKIAKNLGGHELIHDVRKESYKLLDERFGVNLNIRLTNKRKNMSLEGASKTKITNLNYLDVIADDKKLIEGYLIIVKEMAIKYGA